MSTTESLLSNESDITTVSSLATGTNAKQNPYNSDRTAGHGASLVIYLLILVGTLKALRFTYNRTHNSNVSEDEKARRQVAIPEVITRNEHICTICQKENAELPVYLDCGHVFCCGCILENWNRRTQRKKRSDCPNCQQTFHKLVEIGWSIKEQRGEAHRLFFENYNKTYDPNVTFSWHCFDTLVLWPLRCVFDFRIFRPIRKTFESCIDVLSNLWYTCTTDFNTLN